MKISIAFAFIVILVLFRRVMQVKKLLRNIDRSLCLIMMISWNFYFKIYSYCQNVKDMMTAIVYRRHTFADLATPIIRNVIKCN